MPVETVEVEVAADHVQETPDTSEVLAMMREELSKAVPPAPPEVADSEPNQPATPDEAAVAGDGEPPKAPSRRARTVEREVGKVLTESEQKIADAEQKAADALKRAEDAEAKLTEAATSQTTEQEAERVEQLQKDYGSWIGTLEQYTEAQRISRMDPDADDWDFDKHKAAVTDLEAWDSRRTWAGILTTAAEQRGADAKFAEVSRDFIDTLAADLPEDKREAYIKHKDGIPGAVRFYAETVAAPKIEELEATIAERDAEIERLLAGGRGGRSPAPGGPATPSGGRTNYDGMTPEEMMAAELREQQRQHARGRR